MVTRKIPRKYQDILQAYYRPNTVEDKSNLNKITYDFLYKLSYQVLPLALPTIISVYLPSPFLMLSFGDDE
jgi:hypothetical protein